VTTLTVSNLGAEILLPTLDLHCHLRGTMPPHIAYSFAEKYELRLPVLSDAGEYNFSGFNDFLSLYDQIGHVIRTPDDIRKVAYQYLSSVAAGGTRYVEFMISPSHSIANGISFPCQISAISDAIEQAKEEFLIDSCIIVTCVRHQGPEEALQTANLATSINAPYVRGFGLTGNERVFEIDQFRAAFLIAENSGLGLTAHAGEWSPAASVLQTVKALNLSRVGHGISAADDLDVLAELAESKIGFEVCLSSNIKLGACASYEQHPVRKMLDAGCSVTFSTDDPAYFQTSPQNEMFLAIQQLKLTKEEQRKVFDDSVEMAFCNDKSKESLREIQ